MAAIVSLLNALITVLTFAIVGRVIIDWLVIGGIMQPNNPLRYALVRVTEPILGPIRRYARIGMMDLSPMVAIIILVFIGKIVAGSV